FTILVVYVFYELRYVLLVLFGAVLLAIALRGFARLLARPFGMRPKPLVPVVLVLMVFLILGGLVGFGQPLAGQINQLGDLIPGAMNSLEAIARTLGISQFGSLDNETLQNAAGTIAGRLTGMLQTGLNVVIYVVFLLFAAMFMALEPDMYREAFVRLTAPEHRDRVDAMLRDCGKALELWLRVQFITMMIVGVAIGFGLWLLGVPLALLLGLIAGLFEFVPYLGPLMSSVPAILVGLSVSAELGILVLVLFIIVNQLEGNLLIPYLQAREVNLPPLVTILSAIAFGTLFGVLGLIFAVPLGLVIMIALQRLWVEAALEEVPVEDQEPLHE
ncbi:MAG: AI-2E family transporter, partial [Pseudomonadota bacterium]